MQLFEQAHQRVQNQAQHKGEYDGENDLSREVACRKQHQQKLAALENRPNIRWHYRVGQRFCLAIGLQRIRRFHHPIRFVCVLNNPKIAIPRLVRTETVVESAQPRVFCARP